MKRLLIYMVCFFATTAIVAQTYQEQLKAIHSTVVEKKEGKSYYIHTVKKGQTLYMISKAYGVEVNDIISENPIVKEGLKADQTLRIPFPGQKEEEPVKKTAAARTQAANGNQPAATVKPDTVPATANPPSALIPCGSDTTSHSKNYKVVLMLPLYLEEVKTMNTDTATEETIASWNSLKYLPFYEGFRIAVDSLQKQGLHLTLYVYDVGKDTLKTKLLLKKPELRSADLIIGLLFTKNFQMVAKFAHEYRIPIVNPLSERSEIIRDNDMVFKTNPSRSFMLDDLAEYMQKKMYRGQVLIVRNGQYKDKDIAERLKKVCQAKNLNVVIAEGQDVAIGKLSKSKENVVVAFTDNSVYALELMRRFYELRNDYTINLIGLPDWEKIEGLETDFLNGLNTHLVSPSFVDYSDPGVKKMLLSYHLQYKTDPDPLAFEGFDAGYYFLSALMKFGKQLPVCIQDFRLKTAQTSFEFVRGNNNNNNGFENRYWSVYKYESFKLLRVN
jgi:LysM repeat protein